MLQSVASNSKLGEAGDVLARSVHDAFADGTFRPWEFGGNAGTRAITQAVVTRVRGE